VNKIQDHKIRKDGKEYTYQPQRKNGGVFITYSKRPEPIFRVINDARFKPYNKAIT
jgi:hypothetical protein